MNAYGPTDYVTIQAASSGIAGRNRHQRRVALVSPVAINIGTAFGLNTASTVTSNVLEPITTKGLAGLAPSWRWLNVRQTTNVDGYTRGNAHLLLRRLLEETDSSGSIARRLAWGKLTWWSGPSRVAENYDLLTLLLEPRGFRVKASSIIDVWNYSFGLNKSSRMAGLARHFKLGGFVIGGLTDAFIGGGIQYFGDLNDPVAMTAIANDPGLQWRRVGAAAGTNLTVGVIGGGVTAIGWGIAIGVFGISTPPGWIIVGTGVVITTGIGFWKGDEIKDSWFQWMNADIQTHKN